MAGFRSALIVLCFHAGRAKTLLTKALDEATTFTVNDIVKDFKAKAKLGLEHGAGSLATRLSLLLRRWYWSSAAGAASSAEFPVLFHGIVPVVGPPGLITVKTDEIDALDLQFKMAPFEPLFQQVTRPSFNSCAHAPVRRRLLSSPSCTLNAFRLRLRC